MTTIDRLLIETARVDEASADSLARGRAGLDQVLTELVDRRPARGRVQFGGRRRLALTGIAAAVVAVVITIPVLSFNGGRTGVNAEAATVLHRAGQAAGSQPGGWAQAPYWHVASSYVRDGVAHHRDIWVAHHGTSVLHDTGLPGGPAYISLGAAAFSAGSGSLTWDQLMALPTNPDLLKATLRADIKGAGNGDNAELFVMVGDLLRESPAPPALRKALYDVAASIPGVRVKGQVTDSAGRTGTAVERDDETLLIDTTTGQLLADTDGSFTATYLNQGPTDTAPAISGN